MKKPTANLLPAIFNGIAALCFLIVACFPKPTVAKYGFLAAAVFLLIGAGGFLYTYLKNRKEK